MNLPDEPVYLPFEPGPFRMAMGLVAATLDDLVVIDRHYPAEMAERRDLLTARHAEVFGAEAGSTAARAEVLSRLVELLPRRYPAWFSRDGDTLRNHLTKEAWNLADPGCDPLELAGRLVQEDFCLLRLTEAGPVLTAAVLCFPSRWRLHEKLGHKLADIHASVPGYADRLAGPVDRLMVNLRAGKLVQRLNWSLNDDPALFQPAAKHFRHLHNDGVTAGNAGDTLFLRVERQTLSLLPASGAVLFGIRVHVYPIARIVAVPDAAGRLAAAVRALPDGLRRYKSLAPFEGALLAYLDAQAAGEKQQGLPHAQC